MEAAASIAASGAASIKGGNWQIFENFVHRSGARVFLNTNVTSISRKSPTTWTVATSQGAADYLAVILAAPYHTSDISIPEDLAALIPKQPYVHLHVTLLATTAQTPNPAYFGLPAGAGVPTSVLTTLAGARKGGKAPEFNSLTYHGKLVKAEGAQKSADASESETAAKESEGASPDSGTSPLEANVETEAEAGAETEAVPAPPAPAQDEWVVKIFSMGPMSDEWLADIFQGQVGWVLRKEVRDRAIELRVVRFETDDNYRVRTVGRVPGPPAHEHLCARQARPRAVLRQRFRAVRAAPPCPTVDNLLTSIRVLACLLSGSSRRWKRRRSRRATSSTGS